MAGAMERRDGAAPPASQLAAGPLRAPHEGSPASRSSTAPRRADTPAPPPRAGGPVAPRKGRASRRSRCCASRWLTRRVPAPPLHRASPGARTARHAVWQVFAWRDPGLDGGGPHHRDVIDGAGGPQLAGQRLEPGMGGGAPSPHSSCASAHRCSRAWYQSTICTARTKRRLASFQIHFAPSPSTTTRWDQPRPRRCTAASSWRPKVWACGQRGGVGCGARFHCLHRCGGLAAGPPQARQARRARYAPDQLVDGAELDLLPAIVGPFERPIHRDDQRVGRSRRALHRGLVGHRAPFSQRGRVGPNTVGILLVLACAAGRLGVRAHGVGGQVRGRAQGRPGQLQQPGALPEGQSRPVPGYQRREGGREPGGAGATWGRCPARPGPTCHRRGRARRSPSPAGAAGVAAIAGVSVAPLPPLPPLLVARCRATPIRHRVACGASARGSPPRRTPPAPG